MKKSIFNFSIITVCLVMTLVACSSKNPSPSPSKDPQPVSNESNRINTNSINDKVSNISNKVNSLLELMANFSYKEIEYDVHTTSLVIDSGYISCFRDSKSPSPDSNVCELISRTFNHQIFSDTELHSRISSALKDLKRYLRDLTSLEVESIYVDVNRVNDEISNRINSLTELMTNFKSEELQYHIHTEQLLVDAGYAGCHINSNSSSPDSNICEFIAKTFDHQRTDTELHVQIDIALREITYYLEYI